MKAVGVGFRVMLVFGVFCYDSPCLAATGLDVTLLCSRLVLRNGLVFFRFDVLLIWEDKPRAVAHGNKSGWISTHTVTVTQRRERHAQISLKHNVQNSRLL